MTPYPLDRLPCPLCAVGFARSSSHHPCDQAAALRHLPRCMDRVGHVSACMHGSTAQGLAYTLSLLVRAPPSGSPPPFAAAPQVPSAVTAQPFPQAASLGIGRCCCWFVVTRRSEYGLPLGLPLGPTAQCNPPALRCSCRSCLQHVSDTSSVVMPAALHHGNPHCALQGSACSSPTLPASSCAGRPHHYPCTSRRACSPSSEAVPPLCHSLQEHFALCLSTSPPSSWCPCRNASMWRWRVGCASCRQA